MSQSRISAASRRALSVPVRSSTRRVGVPVRNLARQTSVTLNPLVPNGHPFNVDLRTPFVRKELSKLFGDSLRPLLDVLGVQMPPSWTHESTRITPAQFIAFINRFNKAIDEFRSKRASRRRTPLIIQQISQPILPYPIIRGILTFVRDVVNRDENELQEGAFGDMVYGRTSDDQIYSFVQELKIGANDVFFDLGSGIGNVVSLVAAIASVKQAVGIEMGETAAGVAEAHHQLFQAVMSWFGHHDIPITLHKDTFLRSQYLDMVKSEATVILINNKAFGPDTMHTLTEVFAQCKDQTKIITTESMVSEYRSNRGNLLHPISTTRKLILTPQNAGWQGTSCPYFVTEIDRKAASRSRATSASRSRSRR